MLVLGVLLALSLATIVAVLVSCEVQARELRASGEVLVLPAGPDDEFREVIAPLLADPDFGRIDRFR